MISDTQNSLANQGLQVDVDQKKPNKKRKILIAIIFLFVISIFPVAFYYLIAGQGSVQSVPKSLSPISIQSLTPTPFPFIELTIPHLRERSYRSSLTELQQTSANASYISYLTSYDSDGFKINGLLTKPTVEMPEGGFPAIVFVHGYIPPANYSTVT